MEWILGWVSRMLYLLFLLRYLEFLQISLKSLALEYNYIHYNYFFCLPFPFADSIAEQHK